MDKQEELVVYLNISEGFGLYNRNKAVVIVASLYGHQLETEIIEVSDGCENVYFNSNLTWEASKDSIKKMKAGNIPIKIECFSVNWQNQQEIRTLIGNVILPIRGIPFINQKRFSEMKHHWYKLYGLNSEWASKKSQILLFVTITQKQFIFQQTNPFICNLTNPDKFNNYLVAATSQNITANMLKSQQGIFVKLMQDEGLIQVGNSNDDCDIFVVTLMFKHATNLDNIMSSDNKRTFYLCCDLLGAKTYCYLIPKINGIYSIQEKFAINFRSSLHTLKEYFNKVLFIPMDLYCNDNIVGHEVFKFENLIEITDLHLFRDSYEDTNYVYEKEGSVYIKSNQQEEKQMPIIKYVFSLCYIPTEKFDNCEISIDKTQITEFKDNYAGGDNFQQNFDNKLLELPPTTRKGITKNTDKLLRTTNSDSAMPKQLVQQQQHINYENNVPKSISDIALQQPVSVRKQLANKQINYHTNQNESYIIQCNDKNLTNENDLIKTFSYNLQLQNVKFVHRPEIGIWQISLHHSIADTPYTVVNAELTEIKSNCIEFKNLELQLYFVAKEQEIHKIIASEPCILKIYGPKDLCAVAEIDNQFLLTYSTNIMNKKESKSGVVLMENEKTNEKIAMAHIIVYLNNIGLNLNSHNKIQSCINNEKLTKLNKTILKSYFDENLAYKIVEELEEWKQKQQEQFLIELKRKECNYLASIKAEWYKHKKDIELKLEDKLKQCEKLAISLEQLYQNAEENDFNELEKQQFYEKIREEFEQYYNYQIIELNEKLRRIENDMQYQIKLEKLKQLEIEMSKTQIETENAKLKVELNELKQKFNEIQKIYLPREQLAGLFQDVRILSERLEEVQKTKDFYKNQWAKIIREVHEIKSDELRKIELHLKRKTSLGLEEFLRDEQINLLSEMEELNFVKNILNSNVSDEEHSETVENK